MKSFATKVVKFSQNVTPFREISYVNAEFTNSGSSQLIDNELGAEMGRPSASAVSIHVSPGERNPIEGKFGEAKTAYGLNRVKARLKITSELWIASIILVLNLVKLAGAVAPCSFVNDCCSFSATMRKVVDSFFTYIYNTYRRNMDHLFVRSLAVAV